jgi:putative MATE family efflux protein
MTGSAPGTGDTQVAPATRSQRPAGPPGATTLERKATARRALLEGPILSTLIRLALPTLLVLLAQTAVNVVETFYVGFLGTESLAGVALVFPVFMLMMTMSAGGIGSGVGSAVARALGSGRQDDADALVLHSLVLAIVIGALFSIGVIWAGPWIYHTLGGRGVSLRSALVYSNTLFSASIAVWVVNLLAAALRGAGNVKLPAMVTLFGAFIMIPASPALIFGFGPIPRLGIAGAGLAFAVYYGVAVLILLRYLISGRSELRLKWARPQRRLFTDILKVGAPSALNTVQTNLTVILITGTVGSFGISALAGYGIASRLDYVMIPILFGLSSGVLTMVGVNVGAGQMERAKRIARIAAGAGFALAECIGVLAAAAPLTWLHLFSRDPAVLDQGVTYLRIVAPAYGLLGVAFVVSFAAQGAGHVKWPFIGNSVRMVVAAGLGWIAVKSMGAGMTGLAFIIAASLATYALIASIAMISPAVWRENRP